MEPVNPDSPPEPPARSGSAADRDEGLRILLVEDNPDIARVLSNLLGRSGHLVATAGGMAEAERIAADSGPFDLLISDLCLPDGSGLELKRRLAAIPGIAVSGYSTDIDLQECRDAGFLELLAKPVEFAALDAIIRRVARRG